MVDFIEFITQVDALVWLIISLSCVMWYLLLQGYYRIHQLRPIWLTQTQQIRLQLSSLGQWQQQQLQQAFISQAQRQLNQYQLWINTLIKILPLLGLLGTVNGMISSFLQLGQANISQQLAGGISSALLTTLAGLVTSLSGLYLSYRLKRANQRLLSQLKQSLSESADAV
ncbi:MotA/TolQ/ExbB proton channel family protein [Shewanella marina]|uniref:MotA/TolQ/ExbB proton channel family protein n=1 Tax=Shewanella marina TaxID=487319 RepID=UPI0004711B1F|nr:MotA/TolQ/ExbB proton channel family protein [Shewanella marina]